MADEVLAAEIAENNDFSGDYLESRGLIETVESPAVKILQDYPAEDGGNVAPGSTGDPEDFSIKNLDELNESVEDFDVAEKLATEKSERDQVLEWLSQGVSMEDIEKGYTPGSGAVADPIYSPIDLAVDVLTGGLSVPGRQAIKTFGKGALRAGERGLMKAGAKKLSKTIAADVAMGALSGGFMTAADYANSGAIIEMTSGIIGPTATVALTTLSRKGLAKWFQKIVTSNSDMAKKLVIAAKSDPDSILSKAILEEGKKGKIDVGPGPSKESIDRLDDLLGLSEKSIIDIAKPGSEIVEKVLSYGDIDLPEKAININFGRISSEDDIKKIIATTTEAFSKDIDKSRRGKISHEQTKKLANLLGMTPEKLLARRKGQAFNAEAATAAMQILVSSAENLHQLAVKLKSIDVGDLDRLEFKKALAVHFAIQSQVSGMTAEAGRTLSALRIQAKATATKQKYIKDLLENVPQGTTIDQIADAMATIGSVEGINTFVKQVSRAKTRDMFLEAWINGLLSGPQTHAVNILSNSLMAVWMIPERLVASGFSRVTKSQAIHQKEALYQAYGLIEGFKEGLMAFGRTFARGEPADPVGKIELSYPKAITAANVKETVWGKQFAKHLEEGGTAARAVDLLGEGIRLPGRFLVSEDSFFKSIGYRMEVQARAVRQAMQENLSGDAAAKRIRAIINDPELVPDIHLAGIDAARYQTFTTPLGEAGKKIQGVVSEIPVLRLVTPFIRTPTNILKRAFERTPLAVLSKNVRADIAAGGARRDLALARVSLGSVVMASTATMAAAGQITGGGPSDPDMRAILRNTGWQPYSILIGDTYYAYNRLEPSGMLFGLAADMSEIMGQAGQEDIDKLATAAVLSIASNTTDKTWLRGLSETLRVINQPDRYGEKYLQGYAGSLIPTGIAQAEKVMSPEMSAVYSIMDAIKARIPGFSDELPPRRNLWGEVITLSGGLGPDIISPIYTSRAKESPIDTELLRLNMPLTMPRNTITFQGVSVPLEPDEYDKLITLMNSEKLFEGKNLKDALDSMVSSDSSYNDLPDSFKKTQIRSMKAHAYEFAKFELLNEFPNLRNLINQGARQ